MQLSLRTGLRSTGTTLLILFSATFLAACSDDVAPTAAARPVLVAQPRASDPSASAYAGEIRARHESALAFQVDGKLVERKVDVGDHVDKGQVLARLDPSDLQSQARAAQAQLAAAQAQLESARADQARYAELSKRQLVSQSVMDAQNAAAAAAQGQVDAAKAQRQLAQNRVAYSELRAPTDGVIAGRYAEAGQVVGAGQAVFSLAADGAREVAFAVPESTVDQITPGDRVAVELWSESGKRWPGVVREVAPVADPASRTYAVRATLDAPLDTLDLGQSAHVFMLAPDAAGLSVPLSALQRIGEDQFALFVVDPESATLGLQSVQIGDYGNDRVTVTAGLQADAWVVVAGGHLLRAGQKVRPVDRNNKPVLD